MDILSKSNKHFLLKPVPLSCKKLQLEEFNAIVKLLGKSTDPKQKFVIQTMYIFTSGLNVVFGEGFTQSTDTKCNFHMCLNHHKYRSMLTAVIYSHFKNAVVGSL